MDLRDLKTVIAVLLSFAGFIMLPFVIENTLLLFPAMIMIFVGLMVAIEAEE